MMHEAAISSEFALSHHDGTMSRAIFWWLWLLLGYRQSLQASNAPNEWPSESSLTDFGPSLDMRPRSAAETDWPFSSDSSTFSYASAADVKQTRHPNVGQISIDLGSSSHVLTPVSPGKSSSERNVTTSSKDKDILSPNQPTFSQREVISVSLDPSSSIKLFRLFLQSSVAFGSAFSGTLRLLAPLILARRALNAAGDLVVDYMRGRYLRTTYTRMENLYIRYYNLPSVLRALSRTISHVAILLLLSKFMGWLLGMSHAPCRVLETGQCQDWCILLWIMTVVGAGHTCSTFLAAKGGPLRVQVAASHLHSGRNLAARIFTRPWYILQWMQDPDQWISVMSSPQSFVTQPFEPKPILFPATWVPLKFLQAIAVAKAASSATYFGKPDPVRSIMQRFLIQSALADEWHRVFIVEKRVGLAIGVVLCYLIASILFTVAAAVMDPTAALMTIPSLLALCVSAWMNVVIFWSRLNNRRKREAINAFNERRLAALRALKWESSLPPSAPPPVPFR